jgi:drug/metabolite transporter (DMT)-like permease
MTARYLLTPLCAVAVMCWSHGRRWPRLEREEWGVIVVLALLGHVAHVTVMTHAMNLSTPFSSALISACGPLFTLLIVRFTGSHRFSGRQVSGLVLAIAGVLVFLSDKLRASAAHSIGDVLLLLGTVLFACHTVAARRAIDRLGVLVVMAYTTFAATVPILVMNLPAALAAPWGELSSTLWLGLFYSLTIASFGGWLAWGWLNATLGVPRTAPLLYLLPPVTGLIAWSTLGETFTAMKIAGSVMALGGVALAQSVVAQPVAASTDVK